MKMSKEKQCVGKRDGFTNKHKNYGTTGDSQQNHDQNRNPTSFWSGGLQNALVNGFNYLRGKDGYTQIDSNNDGNNSRFGNGS
jgi:hypothetical protein